MWRKLMIVISALAIVFLAFPGQGIRSAGAQQAAGENASPGPSGWSSGWVPLTLGNHITLTHNLGGDLLQYATQLWFLDTDDGFGINTRAYGGLEAGGEYLGASWSKLTDTDVELYRFGYDIFADDVRMWIWIPDTPPDYCSPWTAFQIGGSQVFTHNLGGDANDYVVGLWFKGQTAYGINQQFMGGEENMGKFNGAWWHNLTNSTITVTRGADDPVASEVRVCVTVADPPGYDSGWVDIDPDQTKILAHALHGRVDGYIVRMEFKDADPSGLGIHLRDVGGNAVGDLWLGGAWQNLTNTSIGVYRFPDDVVTDQVRVRIWQRATATYLPLVIR
jgi:hypothetical protein